jgi:hypothetical protein
MAKLRSLPPLVAQADTRTTRLPPKLLNPIYNSPEFRNWRTLVIDRAAGQCEAIINGRRCEKAAPHHRMYADHVIELRDGGAPFDARNGQCLCRSHHEIKKITAQKQRLQTIQNRRAQS